MNAVLVPLPAPGAPPSRMISLGNRRLSRPKSASISCQTDSKIRCASLISRSVILPLVGVGTGETVAVVGMTGGKGLEGFGGEFDKRNRRPEPACDGDGRRPFALEPPEERIPARIWLQWSPGSADAPGFPARFSRLALSETGLGIDPMAGSGFDRSFHAKYVLNCACDD